MSKKVTKYRVSYSFDGKIKEHEVTNETKRHITYIYKWPEYEEHVTEVKHSSLHAWHNTWEAAHEHLLIEAENRFHDAKVELESAEYLLRNVKDMKKP